MMSYLNLNALSELEMEWVRRFRFSKCLDTLDRQVELSEARCDSSDEPPATKYKTKQAINVAWCVREKELQSIGAPVFKRGKVIMS